MNNTVTRISLGLLQAFVAFTCLFGAVAVVPTLPLDWLRAGPFTDFTIPAIALGLVGLAAIVALVLLVVEPRLGGAASVVAGAMMIFFELVEIGVVGFSLVVHGPELFQSWLQVVYIVIGAIGMALGYHLWSLETHPRAFARPAH